MRIVQGSSSEVIYFVAFSTADHVTRVSNHTTAGFGVKFIKDASTLAGNFAITNVDGSSSPGVYALHLIDSTVTGIPAGIDNRELAITISGSMDTITRTVELYRRTVTTGQTLTVNSSGEPTNVISKLTSIDTDIDTALTRLSSLGTNVDTAITNIAAIKVETTAIKAKTDSLTFTVAGHADANIHYVNNVQVNGSGSTADPWGPV